MTTSTIITFKEFNDWKNVDCICFDVDSTVCIDEGIDELAAYCHVEEEVKQMTKTAMEGGLSFREALKKRLDLMKPSESLVKQFLADNPPQLTPGVKELINLFHQNGIDVYLISGGFEKIIHPVAKLLSIPLDHVYANRLIFNNDKEGSYAGFDEGTLTSESGGKGRVVSHLKNSKKYKNVAFIGDGITDMEAVPPADVFLGFGGNVERELVKSQAIHYFHSMEDISQFLVDKGVIHKL